MSADIAWQVIRNNSCFLKTKRNVQKKFSTEKFNLLGVNSQRYNGLIKPKGVDIAAGLVVSTKIAKNSNKPEKSAAVTVIKSNNPPRAMKRIRQIVKNYKSILTMPALRRTSQLLRTKKIQKVEAATQEAV